MTVIARRFVNTRAAAEYAGVHSRTIYRLVDSGDLPAYRLGGHRIIRIDLNDIDRLFGRVDNAAMFDTPTEHDQPVDGKATFDPPTSDPPTRNRVPSSRGTAPRRGRAR